MPLPSFDLLELVFVGLAFFFGSLMMHILAAKLVYSHPKFLNRVAVGVMSSAFVKMTQGKLLKKVVNGVASALSNIKIPDVGDLMKEIPENLLEKIPPDIMEKVKGGDITDIGGLQDMLGGLLGGKKSSGGMSEILGLMEALSKFGSMIGGKKPGGGGSGGYNPGN